MTVATSFISIKKGHFQNLGESTCRCSIAFDNLVLNDAGDGSYKT